MAYDSLLKNNRHNDNETMQSFHRRLGVGIWCIVLNTDFRALSLITGSHQNTQSVSHTTLSSSLCAMIAHSISTNRRLNSSLIFLCQEGTGSGAGCGKASYPTSISRPSPIKTRACSVGVASRLPKSSVKSDFRKRWPRTLRTTSCVSQRSFCISPTIFSHLCFRSGGCWLEHLVDLLHQLDLELFEAEVEHLVRLMVLDHQSVQGCLSNPKLRSSRRRVEDF